MKRVSRFFAFLVIYSVISAPLLALAMTSASRMQHYRLEFEISSAGTEFLLTHSRLLGSSLFWISLGNSVSFALCASLIAAALAYCFSLGLRLSLRSQVRWAMFWFLLAPLFSNYYLRTFSWALAIGDTGLWATLWLKIFHTTEHPHLLFTRLGTLIYFVFAAIPFAALFTFIGMQATKDAEVDAAQNLGAGTRKIVSVLITRRAREAMIIGVIFAFVFVFGDHIGPGVIGGNNTYVMPLWVVDLWKESNFPKAASVALIQSFFVAGLIVIATSWLRRRQP